MADVFVSYASENRAIAEILSRGLEGSGLSVWWDRHIRGGVRFRKEIDRQLNEAKVVVVLWSAESLDSEWVCDEAQQARDHNKLIPVRLDNVSPPLGFRQTQSLDFDGWTGDVTSRDFLRLLHSIRLILGSTAAGSPDAVAQPRRVEGPPLVRRNSICVLPFVNMSGDVEQEYFSDGISEDIITDLGKVSALFVIARNTAFTFKAKSVDVSQVARQLNVSHVLEGSVRKAGGRVRITAQLIDGVTGGQVWAERYDRDLIDIFALQDEISESVVKALKLVLLSQEKQQIERRGTNNLEAYDLYLRGTRPAFGPDQWSARIALLASATRLAPDYADAWGELAKARGFWRLHRPQAEQAEITNAVSAEADRALALDPQNLPALGALFYIVPEFGGFFEAARLVERMQQIAANDIDVLSRASDHVASVGRMRDAINLADRAYEISPLDHSAANHRAQKLSTAVALRRPDRVSRISCRAGPGTCSLHKLC